MSSSYYPSMPANRDERSLDPPGWVRTKATRYILHDIAAPYDRTSFKEKVASLTCKGLSEDDIEGIYDSFDKNTYKAKVAWLTKETFGPAEKKFSPAEIKEIYHIPGYYPSPYDELWTEPETNFMADSPTRQQRSGDSLEAVPSRRNGASNWTHSRPPKPEDEDYHARKYVYDYLHSPGPRPEDRESLAGQRGSDFIHAPGPRRENRDYYNSGPGLHGIYAPGQGVYGPGPGLGPSGLPSIGKLHPISYLPSTHVVTVTGPPSAVGCPTPYPQTFSSGYNHHPGSSHGPSHGYPNDNYNLTKSVLLLWVRVITMITPQREVTKKTRLG